nr:hypothetical protein Q903MT_gene2398 [Picea sitchensis]
MAFLIICCEKASIVSSVMGFLGYSGSSGRRNFGPCRGFGTRYNYRAKCNVQYHRLKRLHASSFSKSCLRPTSRTTSADCLLHDG